MGKHDDTSESAGREMTSRRLKAMLRSRRIRRERHSWRFVNLGLAAAILVGSGLAALSGQHAAAQAADAEAEQNDTVVQADWQVDSVLAGMRAEWAAEQAAREKAAEEAEKQAAEEAAKKAAEEEAARLAAEEAERLAAEEAERAAAEAEAAANPWTAPSTAPITSYYGMRDGRLHGGTDFGNFEGDEIKVVGDGTVTYVGYEPGGYGNVVYVDHGDGVETRYAHASEVLVNVGDEVAKGDTIILAGTTGNSTGPHLHFEVLLNGEKVDSLAWLQEQGVDVG
ncbi:M23 family metallopeptidase [Glycomyces niveus]|uniref:M23 family metallopeptidase n=1 Tax=Glycomyces niveus TaxID=2820287 RepID=A0ABS3U7X5_9ACTN|nr:M23 family metallopeptidase [Glycomyces sp. NEAU-S30]MBO3734843.1 M23 family metallopeptidase [Glycomyces sp. NEAU-S30]